MNAATLALVLTAAVLHAFWNFLAKWSGGGAALAALASALSALVYLPVFAVALLAGERLDGTLLAAAALGAVLHAGYFLSLQRSYSEGNLSLVYPLARGVGPLLAVAVAIAFLGERPTPLALAGGLLILAAVLSLAVGEGGTRIAAGAGRALVTGVFIAAYTLWDKHAVSSLGLAPFLYYWAVNTGEAVVLSPFLRSRAADVSRLWRQRRAAICGIAVVSPIAYLLVLIALQHAPVSHVAPAREVSVVIGATIGVKALSEPHGRRRIAAAGAIVAGIAAMALG